MLQGGGERTRQPHNTNDIESWPHAAACAHTCIHSTYCLCLASAIIQLPDNFPVINLTSDSRVVQREGEIWTNWPNKVKMAEANNDQISGNCQMACMRISWELTVKEVCMGGPGVPWPTLRRPQRIGWGQGGAFLGRGNSREPSFPIYTGVSEITFISLFSGLGPISWKLSGFDFFFSYRLLSC